MSPTSRSFALLLVAVTTAMAQVPTGQAPTPIPAAKKATTTPTNRTAPQIVTVTVTADTACSFMVDGEPAVELRAGEPRKIPLSIREHKLTAVS